MDEAGSHLGWLNDTLSPGEGDNVPPTLTVRLRYTLGPWKQQQQFKPDERGIIALGKGSQFNAVGQDLEGRAFFAIAIDMQQDTARQFGVVAVTQDGRELQSSGGEIGGGNGEAVRVQRFAFAAPLADIAHFRLGTRTVKTVEFRNVCTQAKPANIAEKVVITAQDDTVIVTAPGARLTAKRIEMWPPKGKTPRPSPARQIFRLHTKDHVAALAYSPDGKALAIGGSPVTVDLFETTNGKPIATLELFSKEEEAIFAAAERSLEDAEVRALVFSPDSSVLAVGNSIGQVKLFDARTGAFLRALDDVGRKANGNQALPKILALQLAQGNVSAIAFSPDGSLLATCGDAIDYRQDSVDRLGEGPDVGLVKLWDAQTGKLKQDLKGEHIGQVLDVAFSPDGDFLASAGNWAADTPPGTGVKLWDPHTYQVKKRLPIPNGHLGGGSPLGSSFSPDGKRLAIGMMKYDKSTDVTSGSINVVYPASGILDLSWLVPRSVRPVAFSPDGTTIAAFSAKSTLTVWDSATGLPQRELRPTEKSADERWECFAFARIVIGWRSAGSMPRNTDLSKRGNWPASPKTPKPQPEK